jgi:dTDP-4-amino-4,6-dideoxygalactose transaminase
VQPNWHVGDLARFADKTLPSRLASELCTHYGVKHCMLLDRARSGLYLLTRAFGADGEWISTSMMHRPASVLLKQYCAGLAFADIENDLTIDPLSAERLVSPRTCAVLATHTYGKAADVIKLRDLADRKGLLLVENAVHMASGFSVRGRPLGTWGDAALLSFNVDKPLGALLGGALLTNRDDIWEAVQSYPLGASNWQETLDRMMTTYLAYRLKPMFLRFPWMSKHKIACDGVAEIENFSAESYNSYEARHSHPVQVAAALACLTREQAILEVRRRNAEQLTSQLQSVHNLILPESTPDRPHSFTYYPIALHEGSRFKLGMKLSRSGIETKWRYHPIHLETGFEECRHDDLSRTESLWAQHLLLPAGRLTSEPQIAYLADQVRQATFNFGR